MTRVNRYGQPVARTVLGESPAPRLKPLRQLGFPDAIEAAAAAVGEGWLGEAYAAVVHVAGRRERFTADDVWIELGRRKTRAVPGDARAMGAVLRRAASSGIVRRLRGEFRASTRRERHRGPVQVWESVIVTPKGGAE